MTPVNLVNSWNNLVLLGRARVNGSDLMSVMTAVQSIKRGLKVSWFPALLYTHLTITHLAMFMSFTSVYQSNIPEAGKPNPKVESQNMRDPMSCLLAIFIIFQTTFWFWSLTYSHCYITLYKDVWGVERKCTVCLYKKWNKIRTGFSGFFPPSLSQSVSVFLSPCLFACLVLVCVFLLITSDFHNFEKVFFREEEVAR